MFVLFLGPEVPRRPRRGKFLLTTLPTALGAVLRLPYTFAVARFGGRNWTVVSAALLLVPDGRRPRSCSSRGSRTARCWSLAALAGVGGGNFASSMANINAFYPQRLKGWALGLNAGGGNIGVAAVQLVGLAVLATAGKAHPRLLLGDLHPADRARRAGRGAVHGQHRRTCATRSGAMRDACRDPHTWIISLLYIGTFGSFIGFGFAFGQVLQDQFGAHFLTAARRTRSRSPT